MTRTVIAVLAGAGSAAAYGVASAVQHGQAGSVERGNPLNPQLLGRLAKRPAWLLGVVADVGATALQALALRYGAVVLIQLLVVGGLPVAIVLAAAWTRVRLAGDEIRGLALCTGGLALAVPGTASVNLGHPAGAKSWLVVTAVVSSAVLALVALAHRRPQLAPAATGVAAGITAGTSSVLLAICVARVDHPFVLLQTVVPYATLVVGLSTLLLSQAAFQTGALGTPLAALSVTEPAVAVVLALTVLHERLPVAPLALSAAVVGSAAAVAGVLLLSRHAGTTRRMQSGD